jgi:hypothetical protein
MRLSAATTFSILSLVSFLTLAPSAAQARVEPFPPAFKNEMIATNGTKLYVRSAARARPWCCCMATARPATCGRCSRQMKIGKADLVTHDIGNMVGYAFAAKHPDRVSKFVLIDAPLPGVGPWDDIVRSHALWHFSFYGPDAERLVSGRERIYLDRFWNEFSADPKNFDEASREHYAALYARPGAMHAGFEQFKAFDQDAADNKAFVAAGKLTMPILAVGGEKSFGPMMAVVMRAAATM